MLIILIIHQSISNKLSDNYRDGLKKLTAKDKNNITKYLDDINENKWKISEDVLKRFKEILLMK